MSQERIYLSSPHMNGSEMKYIQEAFDTNWIAPLGPNVEGFEKEVAEYVGIPYALALSSGTAAIHLALKYAGVQEGDYVFCSSLTFSGSCNAILYEKAIPVFIDSEPITWNMSPYALEEAFKWAKEQEKLPKAVIVVNLYGQSANWNEILPLCKKYNVNIIEDAAESLGATYQQQQTGTFGDYSIFSFNGNKIITTSGGGMVVSKEKEAIQKMKFWATQSREQALYYEHKEVGYNYRMSNIAAGIGRGQLTTLNQRIAKKKEIYNTYKESFNDLPIQMMNIEHTGESNYWLSVMTLNDDCETKPTEIILELEKHNIEARPVWKPMHLQPIFSPYKFFDYIINGASFSEQVFNRGICLPSDTKMTDIQMRQVTEIIKNVIEH